jgi:hypothetical protein
MEAEKEKSRLEVPCAVVYPRKASPGALAVLVPQNRIDEMRELEEERTSRVWEVRGVVSDHIALSGLGALTAEPKHRFFLNESPLTIHLHRGGDRAVIFDLVGNNPDKKLEYIAVKVRTKLPSNAFLLSREPLNRLLDACVRAMKMPLLYQRLDLVSPRDGGTLAHEVVLPPAPDGVRLGPLGGFQQDEPFAAYDAIVREALTNPSPFYQVLCACRLYEGTNWIRRWLREQCRRFGIDAQLPSDTRIEADELEAMGLAPQFTEGVAKANDLFRKMRDTRNAIAHFLLEGDERQSHVYLADGNAFQHYSISAAVLLRYARQALDDLRQFYQQHLEDRFMIGSVYPMLEHRDRFIVFDPTEERPRP